MRRGQSYPSSNDVIVQIPAGIAEGKNRYPRNADHVFCLITLDLVVESHSLTDSAVGVLLGSKIARGFLQSAFVFTGVCVRDVQPERTIRTKNAPAFCKHFRRMRDILIRRCLSTDLSSNAVIAERVIRRGRHTAMNAVIVQSFQKVEAIAGIKDVKLRYAPPALLDLCFH